MKLVHSYKLAYCELNSMYEILSCTHAHTDYIYFKALGVAAGGRAQCLAFNKRLSRFTYNVNFAFLHKIFTQKQTTTHTHTQKHTSTQTGERDRSLLLCCFFSEQQTGEEDKRKRKRKTRKRTGKGNTRKRKRKGKTRREKEKEKDEQKDRVHVQLFGHSVSDS